MQSLDTQQMTAVGSCVTLTGASPLFGNRYQNHWAGDTAPQTPQQCFLQEDPVSAGLGEKSSHTRAQAESHRRPWGSEQCLPSLHGHGFPLL